MFFWKLPKAPKIHSRNRRFALPPWRPFDNFFPASFNCKISFHFFYDTFDLFYDPRCRKIDYQQFPFVLSWKWRIFNSTTVAIYVSFIFKDSLCMTSTADAIERLSFLYVTAFCRISDIIQNILKDYNNNLSILLVTAYRLIDFLPHYWLMMTINCISFPSIESERGTFMEI